MADESVSQALSEECSNEMQSSLVEIAPLRIEAFARQWAKGASLIQRPANDNLDLPWTFADRLARVHDITVIERPRFAVGQYGGALPSRSAIWVVSGLPAPLREGLIVHECIHVLAGPMAWSEGAVWWGTLAALFQQSIDDPPASLVDLYLQPTLRLPRWCAERRWWCLDVLDQLQGRTA